MSSISEKKANRIALIGFSGAGKSLVAKLVARHLGWSMLDIDDEIVKLTGKPISQIFASEGEAAFRLLESKALRSSLKKDKIVLSTGGGITVNPGNRRLLVANSTVVCLEASPQAIYRRLAQEDHSDETTVRPLLDVAKPLDRISKLKAKRLPYYAIAQWTVHTDALTPEEVCREVVRGWQYVTRQAPAANAAHLPAAGAAYSNDYVARVQTVNGTYPVFIGWGILDTLGSRIKEIGISGSVVVISDETVYSFHGEKVKKVLASAGFAVHCYTAPPGEQSKTIGEAIKIYDYLIQQRIERNDAIVALGGGMVGDLAGFVAATYLRGVPFVQVPTSLIAMSDASIGGKVAVDHKRGKNLIGAFYQPRFVLCDAVMLKTLPVRELVSGWAEVIKYGAILDLPYYEFLEKNYAKLNALQRAVTVEALYHSARIKAQIVTEDEKETGRRILLNFGHTIAHGLESATGYGRFLHGEAVSIGMAGAAKLSNSLGLLSAVDVSRLTTLLKRYKLPVQCSAVSVKRVKTAMQLDKKVRNKAIRWVLLNGIGSALVRHDVPDAYIDDVLREVIVS